MTIADKLLAVNTAKQSIKTALEGKGVDTSALPFTNYGAAVASLPAGGGGGPTVTATRSVVLGATLAAGDTVIELPDVIATASNLQGVSGGWLTTGLDTSYEASGGDTRDAFAVIQPRNAIGEDFILLHEADNSFQGWRRYRYNPGSGLYEFEGATPGLVARETLRFAGAVSDDGIHLVIPGSSAEFNLRTFTWTGSAYVEDPSPLNPYGSGTYEISMSSDGSRFIVATGATPYVTWFFWNGTRYERGSALSTTPATDAHLRDGLVQMSADGLKIIAPALGEKTPSPWIWDGNNYVKVGTTPVIDPDTYPITAGRVRACAMSPDGMKLIISYESGMIAPYTRFYNWSEGDQAFVRGNDLQIDGGSGLDFSTITIQGLKISGDGLKAVIFLGTAPYIYPLKWNASLARFEDAAPASPALPSLLTSPIPLGSRVGYNGITLVAHTNAAQDYFRLFREDTSYSPGVVKHTAPTEIPSNITAFGWLDAGGVADDVVNMTAIWWAD